MSENESTDNCTYLHALMREKFRGHPYTWTYPTKCLFLMLDMTSYHLVEGGETSVQQGDIIESCGLRHGAERGVREHDLVRALHISSARTLNIRFIGEGNGNSRSYRYEHPAEARCVRRFMDLATSVQKSDYLLFSMNNVYAIEEE